MQIGWVVRLCEVSSLWVLVGNRLTSFCLKFVWLPVLFACFNCEQGYQSCPHSIPFLELASSFGRFAWFRVFFWGFGFSRFVRFLYVMWCRVPLSDHHTCTCLDSGKNRALFLPCSYLLHLEGSFLRFLVRRARVGDLRFESWDLGVIDFCLEFVYLTFQYSL